MFYLGVEGEVQLAADSAFPVNKPDVATMAAASEPSGGMGVVSGFVMTGRAMIAFFFAASEMWA